MASHTDCHRQYIQDSHHTQVQTDMSPHPLGLAETEGHQCRHTHNIPRIHKHVHVCGSPEHWHGPSVCPVPLPRSWPSDPPHRSPTHWLVQLDAPNMQHSYNHPTGISHSQVLLGTSTVSAHLITLPGPPTHWLTGWSSFKFSGEYRFIPPTHLVWGRYRQSPLPPAASTRHKEL